MSRTNYIPPKKGQKASAESAPAVLSTEQEAILTSVKTAVELIDTIGGGTEAAAMRVTIANDSTGVVSVDDNGSTLSIDDGGGSITVDGSVAVAGGVVATNAGTFAVQEDGEALTALQLIDDPVGTVGSTAPTKGFLVGGTDGTNLRGIRTDASGVVSVALQAGTAYAGKTRLTDGTTDAEVIPLAGYNAQAVGIVDGSGNQITSFGGGTQYTEDAAAASDPVGTVPILVRKDTPAATVSADGDNIAQRGTNYGAAFVQVVNSSGAFVDSFGGGSLTYGSDTSMTVTNLNSLANSATVGWQSERVSNVSTKAKDYIIGVKLTMANTSPANDKAAYVYAVPHWTSDGGTTWYAASGGTTTLPSGSEGGYTIASPNNFRLLGVLSYTTQNMVLQDTFLLSNCFGTTMPQGFQIVIINYTGAAVAASTNLVSYTAIT